MVRLTSFLFLLLSLALSQAVRADGCQTLYAGQNTDVGSVCMSVDDGYLVVTYSTTGDWTLQEVHLFVGNSFDEMPRNRAGNPQIGLFPYADLADGNEYVFRLPLADFGDCGDTLAVAAHAVVATSLADGSVVTETAWGDGDRIVRRGNWATWYQYTIDCNGNGGGGVCETAFAVGDMTLNDLGITRWGWQITVEVGEYLTAPLYAGAAQNDLSKGTLVGDVEVYYDGGTLFVTYITLPGFGLDETHVYAGDVYVDTGAPGQFGNQNSNLGGAGTDQYVIPLVANPAYVVAHAVVCD